jgi:integrase
MGYLEKSPMQGVERVRATARPPRVLRLHELQAILEACPPADAPFFTILALTGLRKSELFRLSWDWCDFEGERLLVKEAKRGANELPMSPRVKAALLEVGPKREGRVFPGFYRGRSGADRSDADKMLTTKWRALQRVLEAAGIEPKGVGFHTFRHTFITLVEQTGAPYSVVRALARHGASSTDITARYLHPSDEQLRWALCRVEERVFGASNVVLFPRQVGA